MTPLSNLAGSGHEHVHHRRRGHLRPSLIWWSIENRNKLQMTRRLFACHRLIPTGVLWNLPNTNQSSSRFLWNFGQRKLRHKKSLEAEWRRHRQRSKGRLLLMWGWEKRPLTRKALSIPPLSLRLRILETEIYSFLGHVKLKSFPPPALVQRVIFVACGDGFCVASRGVVKEMDFILLLSKEFNHRL